METFPQPQNTPEEEPKKENLESIPSAPTPTSERNEKQPLCLLEQENEFDDIWIATATKRGYTVRTDEIGRLLEKDGLMIKLKHMKFRSGSVQYHLTFTDTTTSGAKPSSFTFEYKKKFSEKAIMSIFDQQLTRFEKTRRPALIPPVSLTEREIDDVRKAIETVDPEKQLVINAYRSLIENGATSPDGMDMNDPAVAAATAQYFAWIKHMQTTRDAAQKEHDTDGATWIEFQMTMFYLDAGFTDKMYVEETLFDHAQQILEIAEETASPEIVKKMTDHIKYYHQKLIPEYQWEYETL